MAAVSVSGRHDGDTETATHLRTVPNALRVGIGPIAHEHGLTLRPPAKRVVFQIARNLGGRDRANPTPGAAPSFACYGRIELQSPLLGNDRRSALGCFPLERV